MLNRQKILSFISSLGGRIFNITWIKKDGSVRNANVRRKVKRYLNGGKGSASNSNSLLHVYLMPKMLGDTFHHESGYRSVNLETIKQISIDGQTYDVTPEPIESFVNLSDTTKPVEQNIISIKDEPLEALKA